MRSQRGMSLIVAIFLIVVIAMLSGFAVSVGTATSESAGLQMQADRARAAAQSGLEFGAYRSMVQGVCQNPYPPLNLNQGALRGFRVTVTCQRAVNFNVFDIEAFAQYGNFGDAEYASRRLRARHTIP